MKTIAKLVKHSLIAGGVGAAALLWSGNVPIDGQTSLVSAADARVGRPLTPVSYAGVARRNTRRAVAVGAAAGATAVGYTAGAAAIATAATATAVPVVPPRCVRVVGAYGRVATVCR